LYRAASDKVVKGLMDAYKRYNKRKQSTGQSRLKVSLNIYDIYFTNTSSVVCIQFLLLTNYILRLMKFIICKASCFNRNIQVRFSKRICFVVFLRITRQRTVVFVCSQSFVNNTQKRFSDSQYKSVTSLCCLLGLLSNIFGGKV